MTFQKILITGAGGQIGSELTSYLSEIYGEERIIPSDVRDTGDSRFKFLDVTDKKSVALILDKYKIDTIFHLAAILSANGERNPEVAYRVNVDGLHNILESSVEKKVDLVMIPSTIGVFGPETPKENVPIETVTRPTTIYGITKLLAEQLGNYYQYKRGLDVRGMRFPGLLSYKSPPGGGTTDYAIEMMISAVKGEKYDCFLKRDTRLPMMYLPDALESLKKLAEADASKLVHRTDFNVSAFSFTPDELEAELKNYYPSFSSYYKPDFRQRIADSWPGSLDSSAAKREWGFKPNYDFRGTVEDMVTNLQARLIPGKA
ncbi:MAG: NAD-dependent epimerase/dehydratase family protein [Candidatus Thermoplasmatota archaeon]|jgi:nucleoside-diphosphate-sugar epimerase|nr:NAD-dependent epimerase/dehydratase family protein [Candidatus Thermoplasmatota archaeon]